MEYWCDDTDRRTPKWGCWDKTLCQWHLVHHKFHIDSPGMGPVPRDGRPMTDLHEARNDPITRNCGLNELLIYPMKCGLSASVYNTFTLMHMCVCNQGELFTFPHLSNPQLLEGSTVLIPPFWSAPSTTLKTNLVLLHAATAQLLCAMHPFLLARALLNPP